MKWNYKVDDRKAEFKYIIWKVQNKTNSVFHPLLFEDKEGIVSFSTKIPQMYVGRVEKIGQATLVIKNLIYEDSGIYECSIEQELAGFLYSQVKLVITGKGFYYVL